MGDHEVEKEIGNSMTDVTERRKNVHIHIYFVLNIYLVLCFKDIIFPFKGKTFLFEEGFLRNLHIFMFV